MKAFLDTSVLVAGLIDFGPQSAPSQLVMQSVADRRVDALTAWHCCLEFYSGATRLPPEFRLTPNDAVRLLGEEVFARMTVHDLPADERRPLLQTVATDGVVGGRVYDAHIGEIARSSRADVVVTDNRRHFLSALRYGLRVETPGEFLAGLKKRAR